jgi:hydrogenase maturation factor
VSAPEEAAHPGPPPAGAAGRSALPVAGECHGDVCVTCSDEAVAVQVVRLLGDDLALVDTGAGPHEEVSVALVDAAVGDTVLVHAKEAIAVVRDGAAQGVAP